jgi:glutamyl endopeptidase
MSFGIEEGTRMTELKRRGPAGVALWAAVIACAVLLGIGSQSGTRALAQSEQKAAGPHTAVSSNGSVQTPEAYLAYGDTEDAFEGTGDAETDPEFAPVTESARDVWSLWNLPTVSGPVGTESILGPDGRTRVNPTTPYPYRAVALVTFSGGRCTGWFIGKNTVVTAGHCVHSGGRSGHWYGSYKVYPGRNGGSSPYGYCTAKQLWSVLGWVNSKSELYDYGAIKLNCSVGNTTGYFGFTTSVAANTPVTTAGYPGDKPLTQWKATDKVRALTARQVFYQADTIGGQSGSPVWKSGNLGVAIHAYGIHGSSPHSTNNHGTRIITEVFNNLKTWKNLP